MKMGKPGIPDTHRLYYQNHLLLIFYFIDSLREIRTDGTGMDFLWTIYLWVKAIHVMAVIAWMAGLFYLPRLFVHHAERASPGSEMSQTFSMMETKLLRLIMNPAMIVAWICGILMLLTPGAVDFGSDIWVHVKLLAVIAMTVFHMWLAARRKEFAVDANTRSGRQYRIMNEVPTVLMIVIVIMVIVQPF